MSEGGAEIVDEVDATGGVEAAAVSGVVVEMVAVPEGFAAADEDAAGEVFAAAEEVAALEVVSMAEMVVAFG